MNNLSKRLWEYKDCFLKLPLTCEGSRGSKIKKNEIQKEVLDKKKIGEV